MYRRPEHEAVAAALRAMDAALLLECRCWFGGGTALILEYEEYRLSKDIDFLCADAAGYRTLRMRVVERGAAGLFVEPVRQERPFRCDQYGIRGWLTVASLTLRFEIIREGRVTLDGQHNQALGVPRLSENDQVAEKLLANADRCQDRASAYRDALDLGVIVLRRGRLPEDAVAKAADAYGPDIGRKLAWVVERLADPAERSHAAAALGMDRDLVDQATRSLAEEVASRP